MFAVRLQSSWRQEGHTLACVLGPTLLAAALNLRWAAGKCFLSIHDLYIDKPKHDGMS